ncbi:MAG: MogA/MoaB family molybdenum cofactor biosynthesis protein [Acidobacteriota bacterium]|jgi:molybdenum cofactor synthesis domain-containing protein|nr:MogA/MoaB family molybdenum cofactor biosynthesis protein [Acidobacteriota bacterium]
MLEIVVVTISDRAHAGEYRDRSGPEIVAMLENSDVDVNVHSDLVPDDPEAIRAALEKWRKADWIITTGGTGIGPRDITPEVTRAFCERTLPGVAEMLRRESGRETPYAVFSRGECGISGHTLVVNFPGSLKAVRLCTRLILPLLEHGIRMLRGEGH